MTELPFTITVYDGTVGHDVLSEAVALYREVYAEPPYLEGDDDFASFAEDLMKRAKQERFRLVIARLGVEPLGFALGHHLSAHTPWWQGALTPLPAEEVTEYQGRTFAVIEVAVRQAQRRKGVGKKLHDHLIAGLTEQRTTLLVRPDAVPAQAAYLSWGYRQLGQIQPTDGAPVYDVLTLRRIENVSPLEASTDSERSES